jgi:hypothetical protein
MFDREEMLKQEALANAAAAKLFVELAKVETLLTFETAVALIGEATVDGWAVAMRKFVRQVRAVKPEIQITFRDVWIKSKVLPLKVGNHRVLCNAARVLLPPYRGSAIRLFRGTTANGVSAASTASYRSR